MPCSLSAARDRCTRGTLRASWASRGSSFLPAGHSLRQGLLNSDLVGDFVQTALLEFDGSKPEALAPIRASLRRRAEAWFSREGVEASERRMVWSSTCATRDRTSSCRFLSRRPTSIAQPARRCSCLSRGARARVRLFAATPVDRAGQHAPEGGGSAGKARLAPARGRGRAAPVRHRRVAFAATPGMKRRSTTAPSSGQDRSSPSRDHRADGQHCAAVSRGPLRGGPVG